MSDNKELMVRILAIAKILEEIEVKGYENLSKLATSINELHKLAGDVTKNE